MEQIYKQIPKQRREEAEIEELPEVTENEVSLSAAEFLARTAMVHIQA